MITLTPEQNESVTGPVVQRQYLVEIELGQTYYFSTRKDFTYGGNTYLAGYIRDEPFRVSSDMAEFSILNEHFQFTQGAKNGAFRQGSVKVLWAPDAKHVVRYVEEGYWEEGYAGDSEGAVPDPIIRHQGVIYSTTPTIDGWLSITSKPQPYRKYPSARLRPPFANFLPVEGYSIQFDGSVLVIEGQR